mgnify:FL=1
MDTQNLLGRLRFLEEAERLKSVTRTAWTSTGAQETTAAHSWRLCLLAMTFEDQLHGLNFARILKLCVIHDLGEALHGDISALVQQGMPSKTAQERADLLALM